MLPRPRGDAMLGKGKVPVKEKVRSRVPPLDCKPSLLVDKNYWQYGDLNTKLERREIKVVLAFRPFVHPTPLRPQHPIKALSAGQCPFSETRWWFFISLEQLNDLIKALVFWHQAWESPGCLRQQPMKPWAARALLSVRAMGSPSSNSFK